MSILRFWCIVVSSMLLPMSTLAHDAPARLPGNILPGIVTFEGNWVTNNCQYLVDIKMVFNPNQEISHDNSSHILGHSDAVRYGPFDYYWKKSQVIPKSQACRIFGCDDYTIGAMACGVPESGEERVFELVPLRALK